jgi:hypothetical protein
VSYAANFDQESPGGTTVTSASDRQVDDIAKPESPDGIEPVYTIPELMAWLKVSDFTVRSWNKLPDPIPRIVVGGTVRYLPSAVLAWLKRNTANAA